MYLFLVVWILLFHFLGRLKPNVTKMRSNKYTTKQFSNGWSQKHFLNEGMLAACY